MPVCFKVYLRETGGMRSAAWEKTTTVDQDAAVSFDVGVIKRLCAHNGLPAAAILGNEDAIA